MGIGGRGLRGLSPGRAERGGAVPRGQHILVLGVGRVHRLVALRLRGQRQRDPERRALARRGPQRHGAAMRGDQRGHDGQPQAGPACFPGPRLISPVEPFEDPFRLLRRQARALVGDLQDDARHRLPRPGQDAHRHRRAVRGVRERVAHQVANDLAQPHLVPEYQERGGRADAELDRPVRRDDPGVLHRVRGQRQQIDRAAFQRPLLVQPGQQQHVLDEHAHPGRLLLHPLHDPVQVRAAQLAGPVERGLRGHGGWAAGQVGWPGPRGRAVRRPRPRPAWPVRPAPRRAAGSTRRSRASR